MHAPPYKGVSAAAYLAHYKRSNQSGRGGSPFGQIYAGTRFGRGRGAGIGSLLGGVVRGISSLIGSAPGWLKSGAKLVGTSALRNLGEYIGDVEAGTDKKQARKRAFKGTVADVFEGASKHIRGSGKGGAIRKTTTATVTKKKKCCKVKQLTGGRRRQATAVAKKKKKKASQPPKSIKGRTKFDLLSL
jgi:hypothetical protein